MYNLILQYVEYQAILKKLITQVEIIVKKNDVAAKNGQEGNDSYIVYEDKIYNVTGSRLWKNGNHVNRHKAGEDLTEFMSMAPHGAEVLEKFECIGEIEDNFREVSKKDRYRQLYSKFHPHPIVLHYPMGLIGFSAVMLFLFLLTGNRNFEHASYYSLFGGVLTTFPTIASGVLSWWINYEMIMTNIFKNKIISSLALVLVSSFALIIRILIPDVALGSDFLSYLYIASVFISVPIMTVAAYNGGKITWPS